jgi:hypothetical protein
VKHPGGEAGRKAFFFEKKKQKTFRAPFKTWHGESDGVRF